MNDKRRTVAIGIQNFETLVQGNCFYIDKTEFIKEWWESKDQVTLLTRPRRFGKTLNMDMLNCFFSNKYADKGDLFAGLSIWKDKKYQELQGSCPVIFLSFASVKATNYKGVYARICQLVTDLYQSYSNVLTTEWLNEKEYEYAEKVSDTMEEPILIASLNRLCMFLYKIYGKRAIVLLDEYDTPMQEAYISGYWEEMASLIRSLFNATFKTNPYLERAVMTGITRVSKEPIFSDLNNLKVVTATSEKYETAFGFTEDEVFRALEEFGFSEKKNEVKNWYDGFTFGKKRDIYNPWSITNFLDTGSLDAYWANTSSNGLIGILIQQGDKEIKKATEDLLKGGCLEAELDEQIIFDQLPKKKNAIWSLMLASGYLKVLEKTRNPETGRCSYKLNLTNREVKIMLEDIIREWFGENDVHYNDFIKALLQNDRKAMNYYMNKVALSTFSYFDTGNKPSVEIEPEKFYHGFVLGLMVELAGRYSISSNRESGFGRYDVMLEPLSAGDTAYILEFKVYDSDEEKGLQDTVAAAHKQIEEKEYDANLLAKGIRKEAIRHYGFAFRGKEVLIG